MAYKMAPRGGNNAKTGHGIPMQFRHDGPQQNFLSDAWKATKDVASNIGSKISHANDAGQAAYDNSRKATSYLGDFGGGSGMKRDYEKNPVDYVTGFVGDLVSGGGSAKPKAKGKGPKQVAPKRPAAKKPAPKKEKGFLDTVSDYASSAVEGVKGALKKGDKFVNDLKGNLDDSDLSSNNDTMFGVTLSGPRAGSYDATRNPMSSEYKKRKAPQQRVSKKTAYDIKEASNQKLKPGARKHYAENAQAAMKNKKGPAQKMKKC